MGLSVFDARPAKLWMTPFREDRLIVASRSWASPNVDMLYSPRGYNRLGVTSVSSNRGDAHRQILPGKRNLYLATG